MSFHVYLEPDLELKLQALCKKTHSKRNTLIREAVREYVTKHSERSWPKSVIEFKPDPKLTRFESLRKSLRKDRDDIFTPGIK
jgi:hypothetical protein